MIIKYFFSDYKPKQCYDCTSMKECETAPPKACLNVDDYCYKITTKATQKDSNVMVSSYSKGCATKNQCDNKEKNVHYQTCAKDSSSECEMTCCKDNMCNTGSDFVVSAFTLLACAFYAVVYL